MNHVQVLETMGKLQEINRIVCFLIDKLPGIREKRVIQNDNWEEWNFQRFVENQQKWTKGNPMVSRDEQISFQPRKERILQIIQRQLMKNHCIFFEETPHKTTNCKKVTNINVRKRIVASKKLSSTVYVRVTEQLSVKTKEHVATAMASITPPVAANQLKSNICC